MHHGLKQGYTCALAMQLDRSERLCILAMPLDMGVAEFCSFVGGYLPKLREMRVVRREDGKSVCLILLRFETLEIADSFFHDYHDKPVSLSLLEGCFEHTKSHRST